MTTDSRLRVMSKYCIALQIFFFVAAVLQFRRYRARSFSLIVVSLSLLTVVYCRLVPSPRSFAVFFSFYVDVSHFLSLKHDSLVFILFLLVSAAIFTNQAS